MIRMNANATSHRRPGRLRRGQMLIIAVIILAVVLLLGIVFVGILGHNINNGSRAKQRSAAADLAQAGIRYAHAQMLNGTLGADWRGLPTPPVPRLDIGPNITSDPDALYTRLGSGLSYRSDDPTQIDLGGPDGLGAYTRVNFANGRALVRVRYAPGDANVFSGKPTGTLLTPGRARSYVIIESVGRTGVVNPNDPTTLNADPVQFQNFASPANLQAAMSQLADTEKSYPTSQKLIGFVTIGIIDNAFFVTNKDRESRPMEIGMPSELIQAVYNTGGGYAVAPVQVPQVFGQPEPMFNLTLPPTPAGNIGQGGSMWINGDVVLHGSIIAAENYTLGESLRCSGLFSPADANSSMTLIRNEYEPLRGGFPAAWYGGFPATSPPNTPLLLTSAQLDSRNAFTTVGSSLRDGMSAIDNVGFVRNVGYLEPPSAENRDPQTGETRYELLTRESGTFIGTGNSGRFGAGQGVYVDNSDDIQIPKDDVARSLVGSEESLVYDWLNPNNTQANSGWQGPFYAPYGAYVILQPTGFVITRDSPKGSLDHSFWKQPDGTQTSLSSLRFRLGRGSDMQTHIVNGLTPGITDINGSLVPADFDKGPIFNGVLYFEGNVRIRGDIPTDAQITLVSGATIYIEGSIVRGVVGSDIATDQPPGQLLTRPSRSSLMLMARDYVALNTTQFFGPGPSAGYDYPNELSNPNAPFPVRIRNVGDSMTLLHEFLLNPDAGGPTDPYNPSTWLPYDGHYAAGGGGQLPTQLLLSHSADTGTAAETFLSLSVNPGFATTSYLFPLTSNNGATVILGPGYTEPGYTNPGFASIYGLGIDSWQRFSQFETIGFPLVTSANFTFNPTNQMLTGGAANDSGTYSLLANETNAFTFRVNSLAQEPSGSYMLGRVAAVPSDIRIEASIFAEEGSFFVIPGDWFNPNPNDSRIAWLSKVQEYVNNGMSQGNAMNAADQWRLTSYGSWPESPFYGEPIDAKITIYGSVSENVTPPISQQAEWQKKWGWIPIQQGSPNLNLQIPASHQVNGIAAGNYAPNLTIVYDPILATGRVEGFAPNNGPKDPYLRVDAYGRPLAPMPRLPVSPSLAFFGEQTP